MWLWLSVRIGCLLTFAALRVAGDAPVQFRSGVKSVSIHATVQASDGRLMPGLSAADFTVLDDGRPVLLSTFDNTPQPITAVAMLDMSFSMTPRFELVREAAAKFVAALRDGDRLAVGTFGDEVSVSPLLTGDARVLRRVIDEELWPVGGASPLWQAVDAAARALAPEQGRKVVVLVSDGSDTGPLRGADVREAEVERRIRDEGVMLYVVRMEGRWSTRDHPMARLAHDTGGAHFELRLDADLGATFGRIADELRSQYLLGFAPSVLDGRTHRLEVRVRGDGVKVRARRSYVAPTK